jgi:endonuclease-8
VLRGATWEARQWNGPVLKLDERPLRRLGPDLLAEETEVADVVRRFRNCNQTQRVGEAVLDQRLVAGIGNMWLAEALWHARVSPWRPLRDVPDLELESALRFAQEHMRAAVAGARLSRAVYRKAGRPCPRCGAPVSARGLGDANRTAYWCPTCQSDGAP